MCVCDQNAMTRRIKLYLVTTQLSFKYLISLTIFCVCLLALSVIFFSRSNSLFHPSVLQSKNRAIFQYSSSIIFTLCHIEKLWGGFVLVINFKNMKTLQLSGHTEPRLMLRNGILCCSCIAAVMLWNALEIAIETTNKQAVVVCYWEVFLYFGGFRSGETFTRLLFGSRLLQPECFF